jgi:hypothetical protein
VTALDIVFHRFEGSPDLVFVDVEIDGSSVQIGEWIDSADGTVVLRLPAGGG